MADDRAALKILSPAGEKFLGADELTGPADNDSPSSFSEDSAFPAGASQDSNNQLAASEPEEIGPAIGSDTGMTLFAGELTLDPQARVGVYEQEVSPDYFALTLHDAIERIYLDRKLAISETKIRQLMSDYLFTEGDGQVPVAKLSGGQKARLQIIRGVG